MTTKWFYRESGERSAYLVTINTQIVVFKGVGKSGYDGLCIYIKKPKISSRVELIGIFLDNTAGFMCDSIVEIEEKDVPKNIKDIWKREMKKWKTDD